LKALRESCLEALRCQKICRGSDPALSERTSSHASKNYKPISMADHNAPNDSKRFTLIAFIAFVVVFVFVMIMMLWHGSYSQDTTGEIHYNTQVNEP
jgi:hypothetical protein